MVITNINSFRIYLNQSNTILINLNLFLTVKADSNQFNQEFIGQNMEKQTLCLEQLKE